MNEDTLIALVEDDPEIRGLTAALLEREGFEIAPCADATELDRTLARRRVDLVLLDLMLPGEDGLSVCRRLRADGDVPILMITARGEDIDRVVGLELGADDYLAKPFNPRELLARVRAILRRTREVHRVSRAPAQQVYGFDGWRLDAASRDLVDPEGRPVVLTGGEYDLLVTFLEHPQRVLGRDQLLDWTRGRSADPYDRSVDVQLSRLRRKLGDPVDGLGLIRTVRGGGYMFRARVERL